MSPRPTATITFGNPSGCVTVEVNDAYGSDLALVHAVLQLALFSCERPLIVDSSGQVREFKVGEIVQLLVR